ncbi:hypothetical protein OROHE_003186 [Orobanche hederae]
MYPKLISGHPKVLIISPSLPSLASFKNPPEFLQYRRYIKLKPQIQCTASSKNGVGGTNNNWEKWMPRLFDAEKVFGAISGATSSPIAQYISSPTTFLHCVDPRIKMGMAAGIGNLTSKIRDGCACRDQLGRATFLCGILFVMTAFITDCEPSLLCSRSPPSSVTGLPAPPPSFQGYKYVIMKLGPLQLTRKGLYAAMTAACLTFTILQSASLCLTTTMPEQLAFALQWFILPLAKVGVPVAEVILTLLLSLRFINLVFDEVRNVALGIVSRRIKWQQLTMLETIDVFVAYVRRIFNNIYSHAAQITQAMIVRGFRGDCDSHRVSLSAGSSTKVANVVSCSCLVGLIFAASLSKYVHL